MAAASKGKRTRTPKQAVEYSLEWRTVPVKPREVRKTKITQIVEELQKNPGRSARVAKNARSTSSVAPWRRYGCVAHVRTAEENPDLFDVYAWWPEGKEVPDDNTDRMA